MAKIDLDNIDRDLVRLLQTDDRRSFAELGELVGLSISGVNSRIKRLVSNGTIGGFGARVNPAAVGLDLCAFIHVVLERPEHDQTFLDGVLRTPSILECHHVTGDFSYMLKVRVRNTLALEQLISDGIKRLPGVVRTQTVIALSSPKETSELPIDDRSNSGGG